MNNQTIKELNNRLLDPCLFSIIIIPSKIYFKEKEDFINEKEMYLIFSCNIHGVRKYIDCILKDNFEKASDWYDFLEKLKYRGVKTVLYALIPNNEYLSKALKLSFPNIEIFISCFETINKLFKYYTSSYSKSLFQKVKNIYLSKSVKDYEIALENFTNDYMNYSFICDLLNDDLKRAKSYYNTDFELRKFIFSFYFYRELTKRINVISHSKDYYTSLDEFVEILIPDIKRIESRMFCTKEQLKVIINIIYNNKKDLIISYL